MSRQTKSQPMLDFADWFYNKIDPQKTMAALVNPHRDASVSAIKAG